MVVVTDALTVFFLLFCTLYNLAVVGRYGLVRLRERFGRPSATPRVREREIKHWSVVIPCLNESAVIERTIRSLANALNSGLAHGDWEILVVDDSSDDDTRARVAALRTAYPNHVLLLRRHLPDARLGKAEALNAGMKHLLKRFPARDLGSWVIGVYDADAECSPSLIASVAEKLEYDCADAVQCAVRIVNRHKSRLAAMQDMEFLAFSKVVQVARDATSGAVALGGNAQFVTVDALERVRGEKRYWWNPAALTEDLSLSIDLLRIGARIKFSTSEVAQEGIEHWRPLIRQRNRWAWGTIQAFRSHVLDPTFWRTAMPWRRKLAIAYYLSFWIVPVIVLVSWLLSASVWTIGNLVGLKVLNHFPTWLLLSNSFSFLPLIVIGLRSGGWSWSRIVWMAPVSTIYSYHWLWPVLRGLWCVMTHRTPTWAKTARIREQEVAVYAQESSMLGSVNQSHWSDVVAAPAGRRRVR